MSVSIIRLSQLGLRIWSFFLKLNDKYKKNYYIYILHKEIFN